jgi:hypothetical protein
MSPRAAIPIILLLALTLVPTAPADELSPAERAAIDKGLAWLVKEQQRDGHWELQGGQYPTAMTGMAGLALLLDGNTPSQGRYKDNVRRATEYLLNQVQPSGQIGKPTAPGEAGRYMYAHAFGLWYLSEVYGEVDDADTRKRIEDVLTKAVKFSHAAQTTRGGWGYVTAQEGNDFDEGAVTFTHVHALLAARSAGIAVPRPMMDKVYEYCCKSQTARGGLVYSLANGPGGGDRPTISAAALMFLLRWEPADRKVTAKLLEYCRTTIVFQNPRLSANYELYTHYFLARAVYQLGDSSHAKLVPDVKQADQLTWKLYRTAMFPAVMGLQQTDGSWKESYLGPVFGTAIALTILQQELQPPLSR